MMNGWFCWKLWERALLEPPWGMFGSIQPQLHCRFAQGGKHDGTGLVSKQDLVSRARRLHRAAFLHASQRLLGQAQTGAGKAVRAPGAVFGAFASTGGHVPWSPWCRWPQSPPGERAGWESRWVPCPCPAMQGGQPPAAAALPESWSTALPTARCLGKADGELWLQAVPPGWDSAILQKGCFCLLDGAWRSRDPLGTWLRQGVDGLFWGGTGPYSGCHPPSSCQVPLFPAACSSPMVFYKGGWVPAGSFLNGSAPSRKCGATSQGAGCAPSTASVGQMTLTIVWLPLPTPAPSSAKDTWRETMTG